MLQPVQNAAAASEPDTLVLLPMVLSWLLLRAVLCCRSAIPPPLCRPPSFPTQSRRREQERLERLDEEWEAQKQAEEFEKKQVRLFRGPLGVVC